MPTTYVASKHPDFLIFKHGASFLCYQTRRSGLCKHWRHLRSCLGGGSYKIKRSFLGEQRLCKPLKEIQPVGATNGGEGKGFEAFPWKLNVKTGPTLAYTLIFNILLVFSRLLLFLPFARFLSFF